MGCACGQPGRNKSRTVVEQSGKLTIEVVYGDVATLEAMRSRNSTTCARGKLTGLHPDSKYQRSRRRAAASLAKQGYLVETAGIGRIPQEVVSVPPDHRKLVTFRGAYPCFAARKGIKLVGVITPSPGQESSAGELPQLIQESEGRQRASRL